MGNISPQLRKIFSETLLGRLKLRLYKIISKTPNLIPDAKEFRKYAIERHQENALVGKIFISLLTLDISKNINYAELPNLKSTEEVLRKLEENPQETASFFEINSCPKGFPDPLGIWCFCDVLQTGGFVYEVVFINEKSFPDAVAGYLEIRANKKQPFPMFSVLEKDGYKVYDNTNYFTQPLIEIALKALTLIDNNKNPFVKLENIKRDYPNLTENEKLLPPTDVIYQKKIFLAMRNKISCTEAETSLDSVKPFSYDFCLTFPSQVIDYFSEFIIKGAKPKMLVYWGKDCFIMSDDYPLYLAYRKLDVKNIPVVILGNFPSNKVKVFQKGGAELIPEVGILESEDTISDLPLNAQDNILENRLKNKPISNEVLNLYKNFLNLSALIQNPHTTERDIHNFLQDNPIVLDPHAMHLKSEVKLGDKYRIDLIIQYSTNIKKVLLIELEKSDIQIFTKTGRPREKVTHAVQQVEDWLRWWQENPSLIPEPLDASFQPEGLVVVGRSFDMNDDSKRRLTHLNQNRRVKIITYDDLLEQLKSLILKLESFS